MEWPKIKTILILMMATVNVFLLSLVVSRGWQSAKNYETTITQSVSIMSQNGIELVKEIIPNVEHIATGIVSRDPQMEGENINVLLGEYVTASGDGITYHSDKGLARFYANGEFYAKFSPNLHQIGEKTEDEFALSLLDEMGMEGEVAEVGPEGAWVTVYQTLDGVPVFSCEITFLFENQALVEIMTGSRRLTGEAQFFDGEEGVSIPMILLHWLDFVQTNDHPCTQIVEMELGYTLETRGSVTELVPTWKVVTDWTTYMVVGSLGTVTFAS